MSEKGQKNPSEFFRLMDELTRKAFVNAVGGEEELADEALLEYAKEQLDEGEHDKIKEIQATDLERFMGIVTNMTIEDPDRLGSFLDTTKMAYKKFRGEGTEGTQGGSPEKR